MVRSHIDYCSSVWAPYKKRRYGDAICKYSFTNRVVNIWNSLPNKVVLADSVNCFNSRLDEFWPNQDIVYFLELKLKEPETEVRFSW